ncbi:MAG TPA: hypothetical protein VL463_29080 [Kofleriaceae bacterium]|nr:hypothetical protein [Kofleriaceae bacterium]
MLRRLSLRTLAPAILAIAPALGCGYVHRFMPWHDHGGVALRADGPRDNGPLREARDHLREERDHGDFSMDDALALSQAARAFDEQSGWDKPPAAGRATLADLPRRHWWYLFVAPRDWGKGALAIDRDAAPGTYAAMIDALEQLVIKAQPGAPPLTADGYLELHRLATRGVFDRSHGDAIAPDFAHAPNRYPVAAIHDLGSLHVEHLAQALGELKAEGVAGWSSELQHDRSDDAPPAWLAKLLADHEDINPHSKPAKLIFQRHGDEEWLVATNAYDAHEARKWAAQWLADYAAEIAKAPKRSASENLDLLAAQPPLDDFGMALKPTAKPSEDLAGVIRPIAKLVRRMQVSHLFADRAEGVDTVLLLDLLLAQNGLPPSIVEDPTIFAGREPLDALVAEIVKGELRYQVLARELSARDNTAAPGANTPPAPAVVR